MTAPCADISYNETCRPLMQVFYVHVTFSICMVNSNNGTCTSRNEVNKCTNFS